MTASTARRRGRSRSGSSGSGRSRFAETHAGASEAHATHLKHAARSAGEAFAWSADEPAARPPARAAARGLGSTAIWLAAGAVAAVGLYVAF